MSGEPSPVPPDQTISAAPASEPRRVLVSNADRAMFGLLAEWLTSVGYEVVNADADGASAAPGTKFSVAIVDVPFARHGGVELTKGVSARHPGTPILALSATFFSNVLCSGECARAFGVAGVLPKPVAREALLEAVDRLVKNAT